MNPKERERMAVCRILLDVAEGMGDHATLSDCPHFQQLQNKILLTDKDFDAARHTSVLESLVILKGVHYHIKMMLALTVCELYSEYMAVPPDCRQAFEILMSAIDWPISFSEVLARCKGQ